jgi:tetratricopeptide (TPR) repeat protein
MRSSIALTVALLIGATSQGSCTQNSGPQPLNSLIHDHEIAVEKAPGKRNGEAWLKLAILRQDAARYHDSERAYRRAIALLKSKDRSTFADALDRMGTMYVECGQFSKAEPLERKALAIREADHDGLGIGISQMHLSVLFLGKRDFYSAEQAGEIAVSLLAPTQAHPALRIEATPEEKMTALIDLSLARCARAGCVTAVPDLRRALGIAHANYSANSVPVGFTDFLLGYALWKSGDITHAANLMKNGTQELSSQLGWGHPTHLQALRQYETFLNQAGDTAGAEDIAAKINKSERITNVARMHAGGLDQLH